MADASSLSGVCLVGAGKVGCNLARWLVSKSVGIDALISPGIAEQHALIEDIRPRMTGGRVELLPQGARIVLLCVPDACIRSVASGLASILPEDPDILVAHTSGMRTSEELAELGIKGITTGSFHPIQSFSSDNIGLDAMRGMGVGLEGSDHFADRAGRIARTLGWMPVRVPKERKPLYHAACVLAGNFLPVIAAKASTLLAASTDADDASALLAPMMHQVLRILQSNDITRVLTGPAARADGETIATHLAALAAHDPKTASLYAQCTEHILALMPSPPDDRVRIQRILAPYLAPGTP